jgi:putative SOS response-associated peptidase YedK
MASCFSQVFGNRQGRRTTPVCAILTDTEPVSPVFAFIHDRQPVVLDPERREPWLDPELSERDKIRKAARRMDPGRLIAYPVSTRVNRPANDDPSLIEPVDDAAGPEETRS